MNRGTPPTARNARTGEFTPPGVTSEARRNRSEECCVEADTAPILTDEV
jgi:hypothetical protein